jgi:DNA sulfur modification protein DndB
MGTGKPKKGIKEILEELPKESVLLNGPFFYGELIRGSLLDKFSKEKEKEYYEEKISKELRLKYEEKGWYFEKHLKDDIIMRKDKTYDELLENDIWVLFRKMGFIEMNKDRNFKIQSGPSSKQIDIFAKDKYNAFVIFCTSNKSISLKDEIRNISALKKDMSLSIEKYYNEKLKICFLLVTKNISWNETDEKLASEKQILYLREDELEAYKVLVEELGFAAKYQMYSIFFQGKKVSEVGDIIVPAMYGGRGKEKYYCFLMHPEDLFKIAYVHRREKSNPKDIKSAYQRMVNKRRIEEIGKYIDGKGRKNVKDKGNCFPNNIIIAFNQEPIFEPHPKVKEVSGISYGILKFPPYYGCAWIIDGQHRLYGYSKSEHALDHTLPVIAFESLNVKEQANLFIDINEKQKPVNQNLLWELYSDIYEGSEDEEQQELRAISIIAKKLNYDEDSIFYNRIQIPSSVLKDKSYSNLTLTNICEAIRENGLISKKELFFYEENYEKSIILATKVIKTYFEFIVSYLKEDWDKGERGLIRTNVGLRILFIILRQMLRELYRRGKNNLYKKKDLEDFKKEVEEILSTILFQIKSMDLQKKNAIRSGSNKGLVLRNTQMLLWDLKEETGFGLELWNSPKSWTPGMPQIEKKGIIELIDDTEIKLREIITKKFKEHYGENWFKEGVLSIDSDINKNIERATEQEIRKFPWKRIEITSLSDEKKLMYSLTSDLQKIIVNNANWKLFEDIFYKYKDCVMVQFSFFENFRNKYKHPERAIDLDEVEEGIGYFGMGWIRKCLGLNPKKIS